ncbi:MAG TPA: PilZ domain-containing protein [Rhizomicrobium sp.]|jgi:hypothetical protein|nr:PilZ domain-containing protein [Rhizomicrobium sp.]
MVGPVPDKNAEAEAVVAKSQADRRVYRRVDVQLQGRLFVPADGREAVCHIIDMSPGGAQVACEIQPEPGTQIIIYIDGFGRFEGHIARHAGANVGVQFHCSAHKRERVAEQLTAHLNGALVDESILRRHERAPTKGVARFTRASGDVVAGEVLDISLGGVSIKTEQRPPIGEFVLIAQVAGKIVRHHETGVAIEFVGGQPGKAAVEQDKPLLRAVR